jgi:hypothetical protein
VLPTRDFLFVFSRLSLQHHLLSRAIDFKPAATAGAEVNVRKEMDLAEKRGRHDVKMAGAVYLFFDRRDGYTRRGA